MTIKRAGVWVLVVLLAAEFIAAGARKFAPGSSWSHMFLAWGYPPWFRFVVGAVEVLSGLALFVPQARRGAIGVLLAIMAGAVATHLLHGEPRRLILNAILCLLLGLLFLLQRRVGAPSSTTHDPTRKPDASVMA